jgi:hypothetical protein
MRRPRVVLSASATWIGFAASSACCLLNNGSPNPISLSRVSLPGGSARKVRSAAADGTMVTVRAGEPGRGLVRGKGRVAVRDLGGRGWKQRQWQQAECSIRHHDQALGRLPAFLHRLEQQRIELIGKPQIERRNIGQRRRLRIQRLSQCAPPS